MQYRNKKYASRNAKKLVPKTRTLEGRFINEQDCSIDNLGSFITCREKRVPLFGYPLISFNQNIEGYDRITYLWNHISKPILSINTKRCIMKDLIDSYDCNDKVQKYMLNSFTAGRKLSTKTIDQFKDPSFE